MVHVRFKKWAFVLNSMTASRVVVSRENAPYHDVASVISCFCIAQTCKDWFLSLSLPNKIEAIFIFRSLIYGVTDKETAASLMTLLPTGNTSQALAIAQKREIRDVSYCADLCTKKHCQTISTFWATLNIGNLFLGLPIMNGHFFTRFTRNIEHSHLCSDPSISLKQCARCNSPVRLFKC